MSGASDIYTKVQCRFIQNSFQLMPDEFKFNNSSISTSKSVSKVGVKSKYYLIYFSSTEIGKEGMKLLVNCAIIDLSGNGIEKLEKSFFEDHLQLESLYLHDNRLTALPSNIFDGLVNLENLSMRNNCLEQLNGDLFNYNTKLKRIDFSYNCLNFISPSIFDTVIKVRMASFIGNECINLAYPEVTLPALINEIANRCRRKEYAWPWFIFRVYTLNVTDQTRNYPVQTATIGSTINPASETTTADQPENSSPSTDPTEDILNSTLFVSTTANNSRDSDNLIAGLFWLIIPIILILGAILAALMYVIYKKYFVFSVGAQRAL